MPLHRSNGQFAPENHGPVRTSPLAFCVNSTCEVALYVEVNEECPACGMIGDTTPSIGDAIPAVHRKAQMLS